LPQKGYANDEDSTDKKCRRHLIFIEHAPFSFFLCIERNAEHFARCILQLKGRVTINISPLCGDEQLCSHVKQPSLTFEQARQRERVNKAATVMNLLSMGAARAPVCTVQRNASPSREISERRASGARDAGPLNESLPSPQVVNDQPKVSQSR